MDTAGEPKAKRPNSQSVSRRGKAPTATPRSELVRDDIFDRAMILFEKKGFRATSMREIADVCGVSKPAIYHYFKNKSEFLKTIYDHATSDFYDKMDAISASDLDAATKLTAIVRAQALYSVANHRLQRVLFQERHELEAPERKALVERERRYERLIADLIQTGQKQGRFVKADVPLTMLSVLGLLSSVHRWAGASTQSGETIAGTITAFVMRSLLVERQSPT